MKLGFSQAKGLWHYKYRYQGGDRKEEETSRAKQSINIEKKYTRIEGEKGRQESEINPAIIFIPAQKKNQPKTEPRTEEKTQKSRAKYTQKKNS